MKIILAMAILASLAAIVLSLVALAGAEPVTVYDNTTGEIVSGPTEEEGSYIYNGPIFTFDPSTTQTFLLPMPENGGYENVKLIIETPDREIEIWVRPKTNAKPGMTVDDAKPTPYGDPGPGLNLDLN